jgi:hypothetical protein
MFFAFSTTSDKLMAKRPDISSPEKNAHTNFKLRAARQQ